MPALRPAFRFIIFALLTLLTHPAAGQEAPAPAETQTQSRLRELENQISVDRSRLSDAADAEEITLSALDELDREIALRDELAGTYRQRLMEISMETDSLRLTLAGLQEDVQAAKAQYRGRAIHAYKYGRLHDVALILASTSINQMLIRARYLQRFGAQRERKLREVVRIAQLLRQREQELVSSQGETRDLLRKAEAEERNLSDLHRERQKLIVRLRANRADLAREIQRKESRYQALAKLVQKLVRESPRTAVPKAPMPRAEAPRVEEPSAPKAFALSGSFSQNRGALPWPATGAVQEQFGERLNPVLGTTTTNPGVLIATGASSDVRAVFDGEILHVDVMPEFGLVATVDHGTYKTVYANLSTLSAKPGDRVRAGEVIGKAGTPSEPKGAGVFFAIFQDGRPVDPASWLERR